MTNIQRIIDALSDELARPTAVDDANFRLLFYSPQHGPLDEVRLTSILHRDAPAAAKDWVRAQGVSDAVGVDRLGRAPEVGLLPRAYAPIRHAGTLLGYLWIIDADESLSPAQDQRIASVATELGPLLYRRRTLDLLDREHEREALLELLSDDAQQRAHAAERLRRGGTLATATSIHVVVVEALVAAGDPFDDGERLALETTLERVRGRVAEPDIAHLCQGPRGAVFVAGQPFRAGEADLRSFARDLGDACRRSLPGRRVVTAVGSARSTLVDAWGSHREALVTCRMLARVPDLGDVLAHADLGPYTVLAQLPDAALTPDLVPAPLRALLDADVEGVLVQTLECFLDMAGDAARAARHLHVHRSTIYSRLHRVEAVTGCAVEDGRDRLQLHLGLAVARAVGLWPRDQPAARAASD